MTDDTTISTRQEQELSMDEILSSIRTIITEEQESKTEATRRTFPEDSTTNPSGARIMEDLPQFDRDDDFDLPNFKEESNLGQFNKEYVNEHSIFPDEDFEVKKSNERSFQEQTDPYYRQDQFAREASASEDRISKALKGIVESYDQRSRRLNYKQEDSSERWKEEGNLNRLTDLLNVLIEKTITGRVEAWLNTHLPRMLEKALLRELERLAGQMKF
jgi:uncharacterized protein YcaQ